MPVRVERVAEARGAEEVTGDCLAWLANVNPNGWLTGERRQLDRAAPTVMRDGMGGDRHSNWELHRMKKSKGERAAASREMAAMLATAEKPPYKVPSMADIKAAARNGLTHVSTFSGGGGTCIGFRLAGFRTLLANDCDKRAIACYRANLDSPIDERPIQELTAREILKLTGLKAGELDVFEGSPPCTSFSTAGKRAKGWGKTKEHAGVVQQKIEDLFFEWLRALDGLRPRAFVAENVSGMVKGPSKGMFKLVMQEMKRLGYRVEARVLDAQWLGVPQERNRVIFIGFRDDLGVTPKWPTPLPYRYSIRDAIPWIDGLGNHQGSHFEREDWPGDRASPTITSSDSGLVGVPRAGVESNYYGDREHALDAPAPPIVAGEGQQRIRARVVHDPKGNFEPVTLNPDVDPSMTITAGSAHHMTVDNGNVERRKLTILEVKRLCSFPDDYDLEPAGGYSHQWARLGNSVPPIMAFHVASAIRDVLLSVPKPKKPKGKKP